MTFGHSKSNDRKILTEEEVFKKIPYLSYDQLDAQFENCGNPKIFVDIDQSNYFWKFFVSIYIEDLSKSSCDFQEAYEEFLDYVYSGKVTQRRMSSTYVEIHLMEKYPSNESDKLKAISELFENENVFFMDQYSKPVYYIDYIKKYDKEFYNKYKLLINVRGNNEHNNKHNNGHWTKSNAKNC